MTYPMKKPVRHDWNREEIEMLFEKPFIDLLMEAQLVHRQSFEPNAIQKSTLLSIKTGGCPENCGYCSQAAGARSGIAASKLMPLEQVLADARQAKAAGAQRFCMGAAWRNLKDRDLEAVCSMISGVKEMGMETCVTLGMITGEQAQRLADSGLDYYNHNLDSSPEYYGEVVTTRHYRDRLDTLANVRSAGLSVCCGGIIGMGEDRQDRIGLLHQLSTLDEHPESVPINALVPIPGTPLGDDILAGRKPSVDGIEFVRTICVARILMPKSMLRLSAGREDMSDELQALCFLAGASSIFSGDRLLTTSNPKIAQDEALFRKLGIVPMSSGVGAHGAGPAQPMP